MDILTAWGRKWNVQEKKDDDDDIVFVCIGKWIVGGEEEGGPTHDDGNLSFRYPNYTHLHINRYGDDLLLLLQVYNW